MTLDSQWSVCDLPRQLLPHRGCCSTEFCAHLLRPALSRQRMRKGNMGSQIAYSNVAHIHNENRGRLSIVEFSVDQPI